MINQEITWKSIPIETLNTFTATFNAFGLGQYSFTGVAANQNQVVLNVNERFLYLIDRISFAADIPEAVYMESLATFALPAVLPTFWFTWLRDGQPMYQRRLQGVNYKDDMEFNYWFGSPKRNEQLLVTMDGVLNQVPATVGRATINAQLSLIIYQEENLEKIRLMQGATGNKLGRRYMGEPNGR